MTFQEALNFRHACKHFDSSKQISKEDFHAILEVGRMAPSSMGMEPWEFIILEDRDLLAKIKKACWNQPQIIDSSKVVVIIAKIADLRAGADYSNSQIYRRDDKSDEEKLAYAKRYAGMLESGVGLSDDEIYAWSRAQCYLAAQNMMMQAAVLGIDSCPMEGFIRSELEALLNIDGKTKRVAIVLPFGYRKSPAQSKIRRSLDEIVVYK